MHIYCCNTFLAKTFSLSLFLSLSLYIYISSRADRSKSLELSGHLSFSSIAKVSPLDCTQCHCRTGDVDFF